MSEKLSANFTRAEFACPVSGLCRVSNRLLGALERLRRLAGDRPVFVTRGGGCRSWTYNEDLVQRKGASPRSEHLVQNVGDVNVNAVPLDYGEASRDCRAADIHIEGLTVPEMYWLALSVPDFNAEGGIGVYPQNGFVHVDVRGHKARWMWADGKQQAIPEDFAQAPKGFILGDDKPEADRESELRAEVEECQIAVELALEREREAVTRSENCLGYLKMAAALIDSGAEDIGRAIAQLEKE